MKKYWLLLLPVVLITMGQTLAKFGVQRWAETHRMINIFIVTGYFLLIIRGAVWVWILRHVKLSLAYPFISITYVFILLISHYLFNEPITPRKIVGAFFLIIGIFCIGYGEFKTQTGGNK